MPDDPADIARASYAAYTNVDRAAFEDLMAPDFRFTSPLDFELDKAGYFDRCWPPRAPRPAPDFVRLVNVGDTVFVTYEDRKADGTRFRNTEILTIRDGLLAAVEVYFGWDLPK
jgi:ketosteroid isomerase-like protein